MILATQDCNVSCLMKFLLLDLLLFGFYGNVWGKSNEFIPIINTLGDLFSYCMFLFL